MERPEILNGKYTTYKWDSKKQSVNELPKAVKFELRKNFENMNDLIYYANKVFEAGTQRILNLAAVEFKGLQLAETLESIQALIDFRDIKCQLKEDILEHEGLEYRALKKVLAAMETIPVLDGQLSLLGEV